MLKSLKLFRLTNVSAFSAASQRLASTKIEPLFDRVLVKKIEADTQTKGGIMLPENQSKTNNGTVIAVGSGSRSRDGDFHKPILKAGDKVMLPEYGGNKVDIDGETHYVYRESDIIGKWT